MMATCRAKVICTECGDVIAHHQKYIAGIKVLRVPQVMWQYQSESELNGTPMYDLVFDLELFWACEHQPAEEAEVRLASVDCAERFLVKYPQYRGTIDELFRVFELQCRHARN
jgi:hypothetical protein